MAVGTMDSSTSGRRWWGVLAGLYWVTVTALVAYLVRAFGHAPQPIAYGVGAFAAFVSEYPFLPHMLPGRSRLRGIRLPAWLAVSAVGTAVVVIIQFAF